MDNRKDGDNLLSLAILFVPSIQEVENVVTFRVEPLDIIRVAALAGQYTVSGARIFVEIKDHLVVLDGVFGVKLDWQIRDYKEILRDKEIVDHPRRGDWDHHAVPKLALAVESRVMNLGFRSIVSEDKKVTSFSVHFRVGTAVMFELAIEVIKPNALDINSSLTALNLELEWIVCLKQRISMILMNSQGRVGCCTFMSGTNPSPIANIEDQLLDWC